MGLYVVELKIKTALEELERAMSESFQGNCSISRIQSQLARACGCLYEVIERPKDYDVE